MSESALKQALQEARKTALKAHDKERLASLGLILAAIKQKEVDERVLVSDPDIIGVLDKMARQIRESILQFTQAQRMDLVEKEQAQLVIIQEFLPEAMSVADIQTLLQQTIRDVGAATIKDMGKVMEKVRPQLLGRADMGMVGKLLKESLT